MWMWLYMSMSIYYYIYLYTRPTTSTDLDRTRPAAFLPAGRPHENSYLSTYRKLFTFQRT